MNLNISKRFGFFFLLLRHLWDFDDFARTEHFDIAKTRKAYLK